MGGATSFTNDVAEANSAATLYFSGIYYFTDGATDDSTPEPLLPAVPPPACIRG
jgi:hypothetical protein